MKQSPSEKGQRIDYRLAQHSKAVCSMGQTVFVWAKLLLGVLIVLWLTSSCVSEEKSPNEMPVYDGPILTFENFETNRTEEAILKAKLKARIQWTYEDGDQHYPEGINIIFFEDNGDTTATLTGNEATYNKEEDLYRVWGNVRIDNREKKQKLNTEELFWEPDKKEIYTDKFVVIETDGEVIQGEGMEAADDFSTYRIMKPTGSFFIEEE
jgi:LPS export ABC transporter protein LptC